MEIPEKLKIDFLKFRGWKEFEGFKVNTPKLDEYDNDFQILDENDLFQVIRRGKESFFSQNSDSFLELENAFEQELEDFIEEEEMERAQFEDDSYLYFRIKRYMEKIIDDE